VSEQSPWPPRALPAGSRVAAAVDHPNSPAGQAGPPGAGYPHATDPRAGWISAPLAPEPLAGAGGGAPGGGAPADPATRPWWRSRMVPVLLALVAVGVAGTVLAVTHRGAVPTVALAPPGCVTAAAPTARLADVRPS